MSDYRVRYAQYRTEFEEYAQGYLDGLKTQPEVLGESMKYSFRNGGKRIRPVLALACADILGVDRREILPFALALEMIHTYSLIHDDLPAMDNDDFRRGKPSNHKAFGEANAILAGDGLLNEAYAICFEQCLKSENAVRAAALLNECAGVYGMLAGQSADLQFATCKERLTEEDLLYVYAHKTGKLLLASLLVPSVLKKNKSYFELEEFGKLLGILFQMTDDILDVTGNFDDLGKKVGKDSEKNKVTCVRLYGLEGARLRSELCAQNCHTVLERIDGDTGFLHDVVDSVLTRKN